ncbi:hypothetical protein [Reinekea marinisedimentorum]|uniref:Uncharacterized protein n=1 Tax=Reinekea marinisedimentorum TaxID=230495 RepID=A0A4R3HY60_9GAMM|nr:hypothetical protein [Reinekea marinisedimentorum]TCS38128.1 hypothetical protein BCF53_11756 [Reinekea marinisedimentorum]
MSVAAIGIFMLIIVLLFYWRMVSERNPVRKVRSTTEEILEKVQVFESLAKDAEALKYLNEQLQKMPADAQLLNKKEELTGRLNPPQEP